MTFFLFCISVRPLASESFTSGQPVRKEELEAFTLLNPFNQSGTPINSAQIPLVGMSCKANPTQEGLKNSSKLSSHFYPQSVPLEMKHKSLISSQSSVPEGWPQMVCPAF